MPLVKCFIELLSSLWRILLYCTFLTHENIYERSDLMSFGNRLRQLRTERKLRQEDLAKILGVHRATIGKYETDERFPDREVLESLADFFDVSVDYLLNRTNIPNAYIDSTNTNKNETNKYPKSSIEDETLTIKELLDFIKDKRKNKGRNNE